LSKPLSLLKVDGKNIIDQRGKTVYLRGVNLGGWLMMEGYFLYGHNFGEHIFKKEFVRVNGRNELKNFERGGRSGGRKSLKSYRGAIFLIKLENAVNG